MHIVSLLSLAQAFLVFCFGIVVALRNVNSRINRAFMYLCVVSSAWIISNSYGGEIDNSSLSVFLIQMDFVSGVLASYTFLLFTLHYKHKTTKNILIYINHILVWGQVLLLFFTDATIKINRATQDITIGPLYFALYIPLLMANIIAALIVIHYLTDTKTSEEYDAESKKITKISLLLAALLIAPSALSSTIFESRSSIQFLELLASFGVVLFLTGIGYAVIRHKLFDIRLIFARTAGYFSVVLILALFYFVFVFLFLFNISPSTRELGLVTILEVMLITFLAGILFRPLKQVVDKITNKVFFRDSYDSREQIDALASAVVSEFEVEGLVNKSMSIINSSIKPSSASIILLDAAGEYYQDMKIIGDIVLNGKKAIKPLSQQGKQVFFVDNYEAAGAGPDKNFTESEEFYRYLKVNNISISVQLSTKDEIVGYILFGPKLSGSTYTTQDFRFLSTAANEISIALQNARRFDEISRFNETLKKEIQEATHELRQSNEKLKALDEAKDEFITMASHQLRTPLTSVKGYLSMVLEGDTGKITNKQRYLLTSAFTSSQRMVYLIGDLLNVSRLQTGKFVIESSIVDLVDMVAGEINQLKETANSKDLKIKFTKPKNFPPVLLDETKTRQVMMNFIDNAIYYTPQGGSIEIVLEFNDKKIEFKVVDNGIGVPREEMKNLFTKFYRAKNARKARPDGTGLGLFMAKKVIIDQGGAVIFHSKEGKGSTFGFTFPMSKVKPTKDQLEDYRESLSESKHKTQKPDNKSKKNKSKSEKE